MPDAHSLHRARLDYGGPENTLETNPHPMRQTTLCWPWFEVPYFSKNQGLITCSYCLYFEILRSWHSFIEHHLSSLPVLRVMSTIPPTSNQLVSPLRYAHCFVNCYQFIVKFVIILYPFIVYRRGHGNVSMWDDLRDWGLDVVGLEFPPNPCHAGGEHPACYVSAWTTWTGCKPTSLSSNRIPVGFYATTW